MTSQVIQLPVTAYRPAPHSSAFTTRNVSIDGEYFDDDLPPELFDNDEELEELSVYIHMAELAHEE